jgi:hypothetical protein
MYSKWALNIPPLSILRPTKISQIGIFGLKIYHLATLVPVGHGFLIILTVRKIHFLPL